MISDPLNIDSLEINGVRVSSSALVSMLNMITQPNAARWYRFERKGDIIQIETKCGTPSSPPSL